jgi:hypothetical protein
MRGRWERARARAGAGPPPLSLSRSQKQNTESWDWCGSCGALARWLRSLSWASCVTWFFMPLRSIKSFSLSQRRQAGTGTPYVQQRLKECSLLGAFMNNIFLPFHTHINIIHTLSARRGEMEIHSHGAHLVFWQNAARGIILLLCSRAIIMDARTMSFITDKNNDNPSPCLCLSLSLASGWKTAVGANAHAVPRGEIILSVKSQGSNNFNCDRARRV